MGAIAAPGLPRAAGAARGFGDRGPGRSLRGRGGDLFPWRPAAGSGVGRFERDLCALAHRAAAPLSPLDGVLVRRGRAPGAALPVVGRSDRCRGGALHGELPQPPPPRRARSTMRRTGAVPTRSAVVLSGLLAGLLFAAGRAVAADEFSGADQLRAIYSAEFRSSQDGVPIVPVAIAEGLATVTLTAPAGSGLRLLPEGEGGPEIRADDVWQLRASSTTPAKLRYWSIVWRGRANQAEAGAEEA